LKFFSLSEGTENAFQAEEKTRKARSRFDPMPSHILFLNEQIPSWHPRKKQIGALRALKAELRGASEGSASSSSGFGSPSPPSSSSSSTPYSSLSRQEKQRQLEKSREKQLRDWQLRPSGAAEWRGWLDGAASRAGLPGTTFWVQVQLDGSVRASGTGAPRWDALVRDLAPLDSMLTKLTDGAAR
jgi:hypothetical protein